MKKLFFLTLFLAGDCLFSQCVSFSTCNSNISVNADSGDCSAIINYTFPTASYICTTTVTYNYTYTGSLQNFTVPAGVTSIHIDATGAQGGSVYNSCTGTGGLGAQMIGDVTVNPGDLISILVGQQGLSNGSDAGGGGGSFVVGPGNIPLVIAGGGGGATNDIGFCGSSNMNGINATITTNGTASGNGFVAGGTAGNGGGASNGSGGGGGGFLTDGIAGSGVINTNNGKSYLNGGAGGTGNNNDFGGYGGGGAGWFTGGNGGGGGGYSGGGTSGVQQFTGGGGGGSYNVGTNQVNTAGIQTGNGRVIISYQADTIVYVNLTQGLPSGSSFPVGITLQTFVATNSLDSPDTCSFTITVIDTQDPMFTPPSNISVSADSGNCNAVVNFSNPIATDNCSGVNVLQTSGPVSGSIFPLGITPVGFTATDLAGNTDTTSFNIIVNDNQAPVFTCPGNILVNADSSGCSAMVNFANPVAIDNCNSNFVVQTTGLPSGSTFPLGSTTNTFTATDAVGNTSICSFDVVVSDVVDPIITCPSNVISCTPVTSLIGASAIDICTVSPTITYNLTGVTTGSGNGDVSGTTFNTGLTLVTYTAADFSGNSANCSFNVTILDCSGLNEMSGLNAIQAYPNPTQGPINISLGAEYNNIELNIADLSGQAIRVQKFKNSNVINLSMEDLPSGIYFLTIKADGDVKTIRVIRN